MSAAPARLDRDRAVVVVVDVQEGFRPVIQGFDEVAASIGRLVEGANAIGVPVVASEQYPKGLGATVPEVAEHLDGVEPVAKTCFAATDADGFDLGGRTQAIVCGIESHICVWQTARGLLEQGIEVHVARDAVSSRTEDNRELGIELIERAGGQPTSVETALFDLLRAAGSDEFKAVQRIIR
jgi:nicotinamidase-related amidase